MLGPGMAFPALSQQKKPMEHSVYDHWKDLGNQQLSLDGRRVSSEINPRQGDGWLYVYNLRKGFLDSAQRGYKACFIPDGKVLVYQIKPTFEKVLQLERKKVKKDKPPKDSLALCFTETGKVKKFGQIRKVEIPETEGEWIAVLMKKEPAEKGDKKKKE